MSTTTKNAARFDGKEDNYVKFRPSYPKTVVENVLKETNLFQDPNKQLVALDIGAGTGIFTETLLEVIPQERLKLIAVEPNPGMVQKAKDKLSPKFPNLSFSDGNAEVTKQADQSVDVIFAAQAFHWFNWDVCRTEWKRILKPGGYVFLVWNAREWKDYEDLLFDLCPEFRKYNHQAIITDKVLSEFFGSSDFKLKIERNPSTLDWEGVKGRLLSSSYCLPESDPNFELLFKRLKEIFEKVVGKDGKFDFPYCTQIYFSKMH